MAIINSTIAGGGGVEVIGIHRNAYVAPTVAIEKGDFTSIENISTGSAPPCFTQEKIDTKWSSSVSSATTGMSCCIIKISTSKIILITVKPPTNIFYAVTLNFNTETLQWEQTSFKYVTFSGLSPYGSTSPIYLINPYGSKEFLIVYNRYRSSSASTAYYSLYKAIYNETTDSFSFTTIGEDISTYASIVGPFYQPNGVAKCFIRNGNGYTTEAFVFNEATGSFTRTTLSYVMTVRTSGLFAYKTSSSSSAKMAGWGYLKDDGTITTSLTNAPDITTWTRVPWFFEAVDNNVHLLSISSSSSYGYSPSSSSTQITPTRKANYKFNPTTLSFTTTDEQYPLAYYVETYDATNEVYEYSYTWSNGAKIIGDWYYMCAYSMTSASFLLSGMPSKKASLKSWEFSCKSSGVIFQTEITTDYVSSSYKVYITLKIIDLPYLLGLNSSYYVNATKSSTVALESGSGLYSVNTPLQSEIIEVVSAT